MNGRAILIALLVAVAVLVLVPALGMLGMMGAAMGLGGIGGMMGRPTFWLWPGWLTMLSWLLVAVGVVLLAVWGVRTLGAGAAGAREETPLSVLQRRYARGEVKPEEYERIKADLLRDGGGR
jgi:putative membrane protein